MRLIKLQIKPYLRNAWST